MRIGLFSDVYLPAVNGISYVLQITSEQLTKMGHEVYIFCPATNLKGKEPNDPPNVYRFPAIEGILYDEQLTSVFFPHWQYKKIKKIDLDIIHYFTPGQIGLLGVHIAYKENIPLICQYSTDLYKYVEKYPTIFPASLALILSTPLMMRLTPHELIKLLRILKPHRRLTAWHKDIVKKFHVILFSRSCAVIALSRKMKTQLDGWVGDSSSVLMPTGVDKIESPSKTRLDEFAEEYGISKSDKVLLYVGRLSKEKNLELLIDAFEYIAARIPEAKLLIVGDFDYREALESRASEKEFASRIIFTGKIERSKLGAPYALAKIFAFPSMTDTQGLVVNEAAAAGLPLVLCDDSVSEVFVSGETGLLAPNNPEGFAKAVINLFSDAKLRSRLSANAKSRAKKYSEQKQTEKLISLYEKCIRARSVDGNPEINHSGFDV